MEGGGRVEMAGNGKGKRLKRGRVRGTDVVRTFGPVGGTVAVTYTIIKSINNIQQKAAVASWLPLTAAARRLTKYYHLQHGSNIAKTFGSLYLLSYSPADQINTATDHKPVKNIQKRREGKAGIKSGTRCGSVTSQVDIEMGET